MNRPETPMRCERLRLSLGVIVTSPLSRMKKLAALQFVVMFLAFGIIGCGPSDRTQTPSSKYTPGPKLVDFTENGVRVIVSLVSDAQRHRFLFAIFTPIEAGFHLYGKDLPETGVNGVGLPTRIDIPEQSAIRPTGPSLSEVAPHDIRFDALDITLSVYPEGPVALYLPVELTPAEGGKTAKLAFTYMACKTSGQCLFPVKNKVVETQLPRIQ